MKPTKSGKPKNKSFKKRLYAGARKRYRVYKPAAMQLYRDVKYLKDVINIEYKAHDTSIASTPGTGGDIINMCLITQGDDFSERVGRSIKMHSLKLRMVNTVGGATSATYRLILFKTRQNQASAPAVSEVLRTTPYVYSPYLKYSSNQESFTILWDQTFQFDALNKGVAHLEKEFPLGTHCKFNGTSNTEASCGVGAVYLMLVSNATSTNEPSLDGIARLVYTDD